MDLRTVAIFASFLLAASTGWAKDIYKCQVNGTVKFTEEKCDDNAKPIKLKGLAAPLEAYDLNKLRQMDDNSRERLLKERISLRQKRIKTYRKRMQDELKVLQMKYAADSKRKSSKPLKNSVVDKDYQTQAKRLADSAESIADSRVNGTLSEQMNSVISHYKTLIESEQFQIEVLLQELKIYQQMKASEKAQ